MRKISMLVSNDTQAPLAAMARLCAATRMRSKAEDGQSAVEFALALPCFLIVIAGILYFGIVLYQNVTLSEGAQTALRQLVISRGQVTDPCATIATTFHNYAPSLNQATLTYTLTLNGVPYNGTSCATASSNMVLGAAAQVYITYPAKLVLYNDVVSAGFLLKAQEQDKIQ